MRRRFTRRGVLGAGAGVFATTAFFSGSAAQQGGSGGSDTAPPDFGGYLDGVDNYDGEVVDERGQAEVTISVGVEASGGPYGFGPPAVHVDNGATVRWEWTGNGTHSVVARDDSFSSGSPVGEPGVHFERTFTADGVYLYHCAPHEALGMRGAIVVGTDYPTKTTTPTPTATPEPTPTGDPLRSAPATDWPGRQFGPTNRSFAPGTSGPAESAETRWSIQFHDAVYDPVLSDGTVFVSVWDRYGAVALDAATGERQWQRSIPGRVRAVTDGQVYVTSESGFVFALDAASGETVWSWQDPEDAVHDLQVADGTVYAAAGEDVVAFDAETGDDRLLARFDGRVVGIGIADGTVYASGQAHAGPESQDLVLWVRAVDAETGESQWTFSRPSFPPTRPTITDETVYVGTGSHALHAIDRANGIERWTAELGSSVNGLAVVPESAGAREEVDGTIYVGCNDYYLYAFDTDSGDQRWRKRTRGIVNTPAVADGVVYATNRGYVHAAVEADGDIETETDGSVERDKAVHAFDAATGDRRWTLELDAPSLDGRTPAYVGDEPVVADGTIYVGLNVTGGTFKLYALAEATGRDDGGVQETNAETAAMEDAETPTEASTLENTDVPAQTTDEPQSETTTGGGSPTATDTGSTTASDGEVTTGNGPGFTAVATALGLLGAAGLQRWRGDDQ